MAATRDVGSKMVALQAVLNWMINCYSLGGASDIISDRDQLL